MQRNALGIRNTVQQPAQLRVIAVEKAGETQPNGVVGSNERIATLKVDVVCECNQLPGARLHAKRANGRGQEKRFAAQQAESINWDAEKLGINALVEVDAALQARDFDTMKLAENELACVALDGADREAGQLGVRE